MIVMMNMLVNVFPAGARCSVLREFPFQPTNDLNSGSGLILFPGRVFQMMLLARFTTLLRLAKLCLVTLNIMIVGSGLIDGVLIVRYQIAPISIRIGSLLFRVHVWIDHCSR